ncbi:MAG: DoxX family protein [Gemmatimonadaceae bacterium]
MHTSRNIFLLAGLFAFAGVMHFVVPGSYAGIMPQWVPFPIELIYVTGALEIAGGIGLLVPHVRKWAAVGLILLLVAVFPANIQMLVNAMTRGDGPLGTALLWLRLPLQPLLIFWVFKAAIGRPSRPAF